MTPAQQRTLRFYLAHRNQDFSVFELMWANRFEYVKMAVIFCIFGVVAHHMVHPLGVPLLAVVFCVVCLRDLGYYRANVKVWPLLRQVLDWDKVEEMAAAAERFTV